MEDSLLHDMLNAGLTAEEIGKRLARTPTAVYSRVQDLDKKRRKQDDPPSRPEAIRPHVALELKEKK